MHKLKQFLAIFAQYVTFVLGFHSKNKGCRKIIWGNLFNEL